MTSALDTFVRDRERVTARRSAISMDPDLAAHQLREVLGDGALGWVAELRRHLGDDPTLAIDVARIPELAAKLERLPPSSDNRAAVIAEIENITVRAVASIVGAADG